MRATDKPLVDKEHEELESLRRYAKKAAEGLFNPENDFDERELASGSNELLDKSDAELFPDEIEEYTAEEHKSRLVGNRPKNPSRGN